MEDTVKAALPNTSKDVKLGLVFGGVGSLFILIGIIPVVGCLFTWMHWLVSLFGGFTVGAVHNAKQDDLGTAVKASLKPALVAATLLTVVNVVVGIISAVLFPVTLFGGFYSSYNVGIGYYLPGIIIGAFVVFFFTILTYIVGAVIAAFANANSLSWMDRVTKMFR